MTIQSRGAALIGGLTLASTLIFSGCGKDEGKVIHESDDGKVSVKQDGDSVSVTMEGKDGTAQYTAGAAAKLPADFPDDVPTYPGMALEMSGQMGKMLTVQARTPDAMQQVGEHIKKGAAENGWAEAMSMNQSAGGQSSMIMSYTKADRVLNLTLAQEDQGTMISIVTGQQ
jgi:hypothetical protein